MTKQQLIWAAERYEAQATEAHSQGLILEAQDDYRSARMLRQAAETTGV